MLRSIREVFGYTVREVDGEIGLVRDCLIDHRDWKVNYLEVDLTEWFPGKKVIIPPSRIGQPDGKIFEVPLSMSKAQVLKSPALKLDETVCRQHEEELANHFGWDPCILGADSRNADDSTHLRSSRELLGYHLHATDGGIGHIEDFILDDKDWVLRHAVVHTRDWLPGKRVLMPLPWITGIDWKESTVMIDHSRENIKNSPEFDPSAPVNRHYEEVLYNYYGQPTYWD